MLDPFDIFDPMRMAALGAQRRPPAIPPLAPEEEASLLDQIGSTALSGLSWLGGMLNKPGRAVRGGIGALMGKDSAREMLNLIPFSDALGITDPTQEVRGTDLMGQPKDTPFFSPEGIAGFGLEILTDPLSVLSFGSRALTPLGQAARKVGQLPKTVAGRVAGLAGQEADDLARAIGKPVADVAGKRLGAHVGVGLPFMDNFATFDLGPAGRTAGAALGAIPGASAVSRAASAAYKPVDDYIVDPISRTLNAAFDRTVRGQLGKKGQEIARGFTKAEDAGRELGQRKTAEMMWVHGADDLIADPTGLREAVESGPGLFTSPGAARAAPVAAQDLADLRARLTYLGEPIDHLQNYFPRQAVQASLDVGDDFFKTPSRHRELVIMHPTEKINQMVRDPVVGTAARTAADNAAAAQHLINKFGVKPGEADDLASWLYGLDPKRSKLGFFTRDSSQDYMTHMSAGEARHKMLVEMFDRVAKEAGQMTPGSTPVTEVFSKLGLTDEATERAIDIMGQNGILKGTRDQMAKQLQGMHLPREVTNTLGAILKPDSVTASGFEQVMKSLIDVPTNLFRGLVTMPFPGFHFRNLASSNAWIQTVLTGSVKSAMEGNNLMKRMLNGDVIEGISKWDAFKALGKTDAEITKHVATTMFAKGLTGSGHVADVLGASAGPSLVNQLPGLTDQGVGLLSTPMKYLKGLVPKSLDQAKPWAMRGVGGRLESTLAPAAAGEKLATTIEQVGRGGGMLALLKQGFSEDVAAAMTKAAHVDYSNLTKFEREVMRRLVPFYAWAKGNLPNQIRELVENPGGLTAGAVKASNRANSDPGFTPEYLGRGMAAKLGAEENGTQRFLSSIGMPFEDLGNLNAGGIASLLNPLIKAPIELLTGRQLHTGRDLRDLHSRLGDLGINVSPTVENIVMNSPLARVATTAASLTDDRKTWLDSALNLLTGARVTDVDMNRARQIAAREAAHDQLRGTPGVRVFENLSVNPEAFAQLPPELQQAYQLYRSTQRRR